MTFIMLELILLPVMGVAAFALLWAIADAYKRRHQKAEDAEETQTPDQR